MESGTMAGASRKAATAQRLQSSHCGSGEPLRFHYRRQRRLLISSVQPLKSPGLGRLHAQVGGTDQASSQPQGPGPARITPCYA